MYNILNIEEEIMMRNYSEIKRAVQSEKFDWLGRRKFASDFVEELLEEEISTHYCFDGTWGSGKTTLVLGMKKIFDELQEGQPMYLYIDAWKYENYGHPFFALLKIIEENNAKLFEKIKYDFLDSNKGLQFGLSIGPVNLDLVQDVSNTQRILNEAEYIGKLNDALNRTITSMKEEINNKLIIFVDELDRAKPDFALRMIEMFHHLDTELPTHIVYSVDLLQLNSIIKYYYGFDYNVEIFTHKTFDKIIKVPRIEKRVLKNYIDDKFDIDNNKQYRNFSTHLIKYMEIQHINSLRTINKLILNIKTNYNERYFIGSYVDHEYFLGESHKWVYAELMIAFNVFYLNNPIEVRSFKQGEYLDIFKDFLKTKEKIQDSSKIWNLIRNSSNSSKVEDIQIKSNSKLNDDAILEGLLNIFNPPIEDKLSVFEMFNS